MTDLYLYYDNFGYWKTSKMAHIDGDQLSPLNSNLLSLGKKYPN